MTLMVVVPETVAPLAGALMLTALEVGAGVGVATMVAVLTAVAVVVGCAVAVVVGLAVAVVVGWAVADGVELTVAVVVGCAVAVGVAPPLLTVTVIDAVPRTTLLLL